MQCWSANDFKKLCQLQRKIVVPLSRQCHLIGNNIQEAPMCGAGAAQEPGSPSQRLEVSGGHKLKIAEVSDRGQWSAEVKLAPEGQNKGRGMVTIKYNMVTIVLSCCQPDGCTRG